MTKNTPEGSANSVPRILPWVGVYYVFLSALAIGAAVWFRRWPDMLWFCYLALLGIGIGILTRNGDLVLAQLDILFIPLLVWNADFFGSILIGHPVLGLTEYFWTEPHLSQFITLQHIYTLPVGIWALACLPQKGVQAWKWTMAEMTVLYILSRVFTSAEENINCVYAPRVNIDFPVPYPVTWFGGILILVLLTDRFFAAFKSLRPMAEPRTARVNREGS